MRSVLIAFLFIATSVAPLAATAEEILVDVGGLVCGFCAQGIEKTFSKIEAVSDVRVDMDAKRVIVILKEGMKLSDDEVRSFITDAGYTVIGIERK